MPNTTSTDLQKSVENVNPNEVAENLIQSNTSTEKPEALADAQKTPFIDDSLRTDK